MKKVFQTSAAFLLSFCLLISPIIIFAQTDVGGVTSGKITNPLKEDNIEDLILSFVGAIVQIGYYIVVFFILYSGFLFVKARGDEKSLNEAKKTFLWTVIGAAVLLGAQVLSLVIKNTVNQLSG